MKPVWGQNAAGSAGRGIGSMQPSEFMKFAMPLMMAWYFSRRAFPPKLIHIIVALVIAMIPFVLVALQPDLNIGLIISCLCAIFKWHVMAINLRSNHCIGARSTIALDVLFAGVPKEKGTNLI